MRVSFKLEGVEFLAQGTIYPDVIESAGSKTGKSHVTTSLTTYCVHFVRVDDAMNCRACWRNCAGHVHEILRKVSPRQFAWLAARFTRFAHDNVVHAFAARIAGVVRG
jgi:hypothetical protein